MAESCDVAQSQLFPQAGLAYDDFMQLLTKSTTIRRLSAVIAASSLLVLSACGGNPEPSSAPTVPSMPSESTDAGASSAPNAGGDSSTSGFLGTASLPESIRNITPAAISDRIGSCVESDDAKPVIFGSESVHGFTCIMSAGDSAAAMLTTAEDAATVTRINETAESVENYASYDIPGKRAFSGVSNGSPFVMVIDEGSQVYQEYVFATVAADQAQPLIDEILQAYQ